MNRIEYVSRIIDEVWDTYARLDDDTQEITFFLEDLIYKLKIELNYYDKKLDEELDEELNEDWK